MSLKDPSSDKLLTEQVLRTTAGLLEGMAQLLDKTGWPVTSFELVCEQRPTEDFTGLVYKWYFKKKDETRGWADLGR